MTPTAAAVSKAGFKIISTGKRQCQQARERGEQPPMLEEQLEKLIMALS